MTYLHRNAVSYSMGEDEVLELRLLLNNDGELEVEDEPLLPSSSSSLYKPFIDSETTFNF